MESIELNRLIEQIFADMDDKIRDSDLKFVNMLTEEDTHMITDNIHMYRICQNLIENALKYSAGGTESIRQDIHRKTCGRGSHMSSDHQYIGVSDGFQQRRYSGEICKRR